jgi:flavin reductase (DIM6/NTAB) family NADH-FMN oxidoreductase RutF
MTTGDLARAHRLLAPRIAYLVGTRSPDNESNLIPVSNVTSVSTEPQHILIAVHKRWTTHQNLQRTEGFTLSVPLRTQVDGIWRLGARYSRFEFPDTRAKLAASGLDLTDDPAKPGPILTDGLGWMSCQTIARHDHGGDHGIFVGQVVEVAFNPTHYTADGTPTSDLTPIMQVSGNRFTAPGPAFEVDYGPRQATPP